MGLFDKFKNKFDRKDTDKKVQHIVADKKKDEKKKSEKKSDKKPAHHGGLTAEEIRAAQGFEKGGKKTPEKAAPGSGEKKKEEKRLPKDSKLAFKILFKPIVSEKSSYLSSQNTYVFEVNPRTTKSEIRKAVRAVYDINPVRIRTVALKGKQVTTGRVKGKTRARKKAYVSLPKGKTIDIYQ